jgi:hypothetical protein
MEAATSALPSALRGTTTIATFGERRAFHSAFRAVDCLRGLRRAISANHDEGF